MYIPTTESCTQAVIQAMEQNSNIIVLYSFKKIPSGFSPLLEKYPDRCLSFVDQNENMIGYAVGLSMSSMIPFVFSESSTCVGSAYNEIRELVAYSQKNIKIVGYGSGVGEENGALEQSFHDIALVRTLPNISLFSPADSIQTQKMIQKIIGDPHPCYIRLSKKLGKTFFQNDTEFEIGKPEKLLSGENGVIFTSGVLTVNTMMAAEKLRERTKLSVSVIHLSCLQPLHTEIILQEIQKTKQVITVEDHSVIGGIGSIIAEILAEKYPVPLLKIGIQDDFGRSGSVDDLCELYGLDAEGIYEKIKAFLERGNKKIEKEFS